MAPKIKAPEDLKLLLEDGSELQELPTMTTDVDLEDMNLGDMEDLPSHQSTTDSEISTGGPLSSGMSIEGTTKGESTAEPGKAKRKRRQRRGGSRLKKGSTDSSS